MHPIIYILSTNPKVYLTNYFNIEVLLKQYHDLSSFYAGIENEFPDIIFININYSYLLSAKLIHDHLKNIPIYNDILIVFIIPNKELNNQLNAINYVYNETDGERNIIQMTKFEISNYLKTRNKLRRRNGTNLSNNQKSIIEILNKLILSKQIFNLQANEISEYLGISEQIFNKFTKVVFHKSSNEYLLDLKSKYFTTAGSKITDIEKDESVRKSTIYYINEIDLDPISN